MNEQTIHSSVEGTLACEGQVLEIASLSEKSSNRFRYTPGKATLKQLATDISAVAIVKLEFNGDIRAVSTDEWRLQGHLGATVTQQCVVSLDKVKTRINVPVERRYLSDPERVYPAMDCAVPKDDSLELLTPEIDIFGLVREVMLLELPTYPRKDDAVVPDMAGNGTNSADDDLDRRPFAVLSEFCQRQAQ